MDSGISRFKGFGDGMRPYRVVLCGLCLILTATAVLQGQTAGQLIQKAHQYDNMYSLGPDASQQKAISCYREALGAEPTEKQCLHILYRMAQLYGSAYEIQKGEKPDFHKAIELYKQIIDSYPPQEPIVYKAMVSIGDHYTTLWQFENALKWHKKALKYDTGRLAEELNTLKNKEMPRIEFTPEGPRSEPLTKQQLLELKKQMKRSKLLGKNLKKIRGFQEIAVDQVAYSAGLIDPLRAHGELRAIIEQHSGTFIAQRAAERLKENMDKMSQLWAPTQDLPTPGNAGLQPAGPAPSGISQTRVGVKAPSDKIPALTKQTPSVEPDTPQKPQKDKHTAAEPRAPPPGYLSGSFIVAAGLFIVLLAAVIVRKKTSCKDNENENS